MTNTSQSIDELPYDGDLIDEQESEVYFSKDFISGPIQSEGSSVPENILEFDFSYGYDCKRYYNLTVAEPNVLIFASGNLINFFNVQTKQLWFRRSAFGGGIGHITKNPHYPHIAIAENCIRPPIIIYEWPSLDIVCVLRDGAAKSFTHLNYSPDGTLLASQGGEPDFLITIYNWSQSTILLRTKSNVNEVYRVMFSPDVPGQLTTCGLTHIKFWKMAETFTGLKLQGELGRFGKTEYCDILGIYPMPDEKVVSGTEWGNILVWDEGLIKLEVGAKKNKKCHDGPITQFYYSNGDLWSVGMDGRIKVWFYDAIDQADPSDDHRYVEFDPIYDFYTPGVIFMCIAKQDPDPDNTFYFAQDGNGGIWRIDLNTDAKEPEPPEQIYKCHGGAAVDIAACPWGNFLVSLGVGGSLHVYEYVTRKLIFVHKFPAKGTAMLWLPTNVQISGDELILAFDDGNLRVVVLNIPEDTNEDTKVKTIQVTKPHNRPITALSINLAGTVLVTGSQDATIFIYQIKPTKNQYTFIVPIGYIKVPGIVTCLTWHHEYDATILVGCIHGHFLQVDVPTEPQNYTTISYLLNLKPKQQRFTTYKAQIRRDIKMAQIQKRKDEKIEMKKEKLAKIQADNPGLQIDEDVFLEDSESEEKLEPLHIPEIPNRILWMQTTMDGTIWLSMGGYDAGYIYEYYIDQTSEIPTLYKMIHDGDDTEISSYAYDTNRRFLILAMEDGNIRVVKINPLKVEVGGPILKRLIQMRSDLAG